MMLILTASFSEIESNKKAWKLTKKHYEQYHIG